MTMGGSGLPLIGAEAALIGARQFALDAAKIVDAFNKINGATSALDAASTAALGEISGNYARFARTVEQNNAKVVDSTKAAASVLNGATGGASVTSMMEDNAERLRKANEAFDKQRTRDDLARLQAQQRAAETLLRDRLRGEETFMRQQTRDDVAAQRRREADAARLLRDRAAGERAFMLQQTRDDVARLRAREAAEAKSRRESAKAAEKAARDEAAAIERERRRIASIRPPAPPPGGGGGGFGAAAGGAANFGIGSMAAATALGVGIVHIAEGLIRVAANAAKATLEFDKFLRPALVLTEATTRQMNELSIEVLNFSRNVELSGNTLGTLTSELAKEGLSFNQISDGALKASRDLQVLAAGELSAGQAANVVSKALLAYHMAGTEAERVTRAVAGAAQRSAGNFGDYELALKRLTPIAGLLKIPIEEVTTSIALLNNAGLQGEQVGSNLLQLFMRMLNPTKQSADIMQKYGISIFDTNGKFIGLANTFKVLDRAFSDNAIAMRGLTEAERATDVASLGMSRSFLAALAIINQGPEAFDKTLASIKSFDTDAAVNSFSDTLVGQIKLVQNNLFALGTAFETELVSRAKHAVSEVVKVLQSLNLNQVRASGTGLIDAIIGNALPVIERSIQNLAPAFAVLAENVAKIFNAAGGWGAVAEAFQGLAAFIDQAQKGIAIFIAGFGLLIGKIPELAAAASSTAEGFLTVFNDAFNAVLDVATDVINSILSHVNTFLGVFGTDLPGAAKIVMDALVFIGAVGITSVAMLIKTYKFLGTTILSVFQGVGRVIGPYFEGIFNNIIQDLQSVVNAFKSWGSFIGEILSKTVVPAFQTAFEFIRENIVPPLVQAFGAIGTTFGAVIGFVKDRLLQFLEFAAQIPVVGKYFQVAANLVDDSAKAIDGFLVGINSAFSATNAHANSLGTLFQNLPDIILQSISGIAEEVGTTFQGALDFINSIIPSLEAMGATGANAFAEVANSLRNALPGLDNWIVKLRQVANATKEVRDAHQGWTGAGAANDAPVRAAPIPELDVPPGDAGDRFLDHVKQLLRDVPQLNDEFAKYVAELTQANRERLQPIVDSMKAQIPLITSILQARRDLLQTEIAIAQTDEKLAELAAQQQRLELQQAQQLLPIEQQALALRTRGLQIQLQMLPIQNQIADIDKQIAELQRENLSFAIRKNALDQQALPLENAIADIDKRIAETQKENLQLRQQDLQIQLQMMPAQNRIADLEAQMAARNRENYGLTRQRLQLELARLPIQRQIEAIERQIADAQRENFDLIGQRLQVELQMLPIKQSISDIDRQIGALQQTNFGLARARAQAELDALPIKRRIADIEQRITDTVDKRQQLELRRKELIEQHGVNLVQRQLDKVNTQLEDLWAKFSIQPTGPDAAALAPAIVAAEAEKARLEALLKTAQQGLEAVKNEQEDINFEGELQRIALEQQKLAEEALLKPIQDRIDALNREQEETDARNAITILGLQEQKAGLERLLEPMEAVLRGIDAQIERQRLLSDITINGLNRQKQLLLDLQRPYDEQLNRLREMEETTRLLNDIQNTFAQEEIQRLRDILAPLEAKRLAIQREKDLYELRNEIARTGLEIEKDRLERLLEPINNARTAIEREKEAEDLRKEAAILGLELQKQKLELLLLPLQNALDAVERQTEAINLQRAIVVAAYEAQRLKLQEYQIALGIYKLDLEATARSERTRLEDLIRNFQDVMTRTGTFTAQEAIDAIRRLGWWTGESNKVGELKDNLGLVNAALGPMASRFNDIQAPAAGANIYLDALNRTVGGPSGLAANVGYLTAAVGSPNSGVVQSLTSLYTIMNGQGANSLNVILGVTQNAFRDLSYYTNEWRLKIADVLHVTDDPGYLADVLDYIRDIAIGTINKPNSITKNVHDATTEFNNWRIAIDNVRTSIGLLNSATARFVATQATATGLAVDLFASTGMSVQDVYRTIRDYIAGGVIGFAEGGVVPGPYNQPRMAIVHGGERIIPASVAREPANVAAASTVTHINYNYNYDFKANYMRQQDPVTLGQDLRAIIELSRK